MRQYEPCDVCPFKLKDCTIIFLSPNDEKRKWCPVYIYTKKVWDEQYGQQLDIR